MSIPADIHGFLKSHATERVLSVFVDSAITDPAKRHLWRAVLREHLHRTRLEVSRTTPEELARFDVCVARLEALLPDDDLMPGTAGWMALCVPDGDVVSARLPVAPPPMVSWKDGPVLFPYLMTTRVEEAVIVMVDLDHALIHRLQRGAVHPIETIEAEPSVEVAPHMGDTPRTGFHAGTRGVTQTDSAQRQVREARDRMLATARRRLAVIAGHEARVVIGGASAATAHFLAGLPNDLAARAVVAPSLFMTTPAGDVPALVYDALTTLLSRTQGDLLASMDRRAHLTRHAAFGLDAVAAASVARAIEQVLITETLWRARAADIDTLVMDTLRSGAHVEVATPECASTLDAHGGIVAALRFAVSPQEHAAGVVANA